MWELRVGTELNLHTLTSSGQFTGFFAYFSFPALAIWVSWGRRLSPGCAATVLLNLKLKSSKGVTPSARATDLDHQRKPKYCCAIMVENNMFGTHVTSEAFLGISLPNFDKYRRLRGLCWPGTQAPLGRTSGSTHWVSS